jgi:hypothetical protein
VPVHPPVYDPCTSLTPTELAAFGIGPARAPGDDVSNNEETKDDN